MKIAYTIQSLHNSGGIERVVVNKANWFKRNGHEVCIITSRSGGSFFSLLEGINIYSLHLRKPCSSNRILRKILKIYYGKLHKRRLRKVLKKTNPDIVCSIHSDDFDLLPKVRGKSKIIFENHYVTVGTDVRQEQSILIRLRTSFFQERHRKTLKKYDAITFLTQEEANNYHEYSNIYHIPNSRPDYKNSPANLESKSVIAIGNLIPLKGFDKLISAWKIIYDKHKEWTLRIFGGGPEKENLQAIINKLGLSGSICLAGRTNDIQSELVKSSILISTSEKESFSMVLLEGQSAGLPCIAFDCPFGPKEIVIHNKTGYLIPNGDIESLASHIEILMDSFDTRLAFGKAAIENSHRFDEEYVMQQWINLFSSLRPQYESFRKSSRKSRRALRDRGR